MCCWKKKKKFLDKERSHEVHLFRSSYKYHMALIKHFNLIQLISLLLTGRFLSLSLFVQKNIFIMQNQAFMVFSSHLHACVVWFSATWVHCLISHFTISGCPLRAFCCWLPNSCPGKVSSCPRSSRVRVPCVDWSEFIYLKVWFGRCYINAQNKRTWWGLQGGSWFLTWTWSFVSRWVSVSKPPLLFEYCAASLYTKWNQQGLKVSSSIFASGRQVILALLTLNKHSFLNLKAPEVYLHFTH